MTAPASTAKPSVPAQKPALKAVPGGAPPARPQAAAAPTQVNKRLRKGELLFSEGENSKAMYFLKKGMIRIFKKKGDTNIEIDTVHAGAVIGELAFLDGNPRSASGEALTDCELTEVSGAAFQAVLGKMPDWLKILLKTVVGRLRTASTRIRQLESASTAFDYSDKKGAQYHVFMNPNDVLKCLSSILLVATRGKKGPSGHEAPLTLITRYGQQISGIPVAKITAVIDVLVQAEYATVSDESMTTVYIKEVDFLEKLVTYLNDENLLEPSKKKDLSARGYLIMSLMTKHIEKFKVDAEGNANINLVEIQKSETSAAGKEPFRLDEFAELPKLGFCTQMNLASADEALTQVKKDWFVAQQKFQRVVMGIKQTNEQKRK